MYYLRFVTVSFLVFTILFGFVNAAAGQHSSPQFSRRHRQHKSFGKRSTSSASQNEQDKCSSAQLDSTQSQEWSDWVTRGSEQCLSAANQTMQLYPQDQTVYVACSRLGYVSNETFGGELLVYSLQGTKPSLEEASSSSSSNSTTTEQQQQQKRDTKNNGMSIRIRQAKRNLASGFAIQPSTNSSLIASYHYNLPTPSTFQSVGESLQNISVAKVQLTGHSSTHSANLIHIPLMEESIQDQAWETHAKEPWGAFIRTQNIWSHSLVSDSKCPANNEKLAQAAGLANQSSSSSQEPPTPSSAEQEDTPPASTSIDASETVIAPLNVSGQDAQSDPSPAPDQQQQKEENSPDSQNGDDPSETPQQEQAQSSVQAAEQGEGEGGTDDSDDGTKLSVLPIGLGVFGGVSALAVAIVGLVTYERKKYRRHFRERKMQEQIASSAGYGTAPAMTEARV